MGIGNNLFQDRVCFYIRLLWLTLH